MSGVGHPRGEGYHQSSGLARRRDVYEDYREDVLAAVRAEGRNYVRPKHLDDRLDIPVSTIGMVMSAMADGDEDISTWTESNSRTVYNVMGVLDGE